MADNVKTRNNSNSSMSVGEYVGRWIVENVNRLNHNPANGQPKASSIPLLRQFNINPNEKIPTTNLQGYKPDAGFIPQSMLRGLTGRASAYAISQGDYFGGITFLAEGVRSNAFYFDPASGSRGKGILINTHPGITLPYQKDHEIRKMFGRTTLAGMTDEIINGVKRGQITPNMRNAQLVISDYYNMFNDINQKYSVGADNALKGRLNNNRFAKELMNNGMSANDVMREIKRNLPAPSYAVLQHLSYKYGPGGIKRFGSLLDHSISAALDKDNQEQHLANGVKHIVYHYRNSRNELIQDTRAMNIHRLFYTSGVRFSPELNMKLVTGGNLNAQEQATVNDVAKQAGLGQIVKNGRMEDFKDGPARNSRTDEYKLDENAIRRGIAVVDQNFKPIPLSDNNDNKPVRTVSTPKPQQRQETNTCVSSACRETAFRY